MEKLTELVAQLNDLSVNDRIFLQILPFGQNAVPALVELLLSKPSVHPQPRCLAAEALGILGGPAAVQGLIEVLSHHPLEQLDPVVAMAEKAVRNRACSELARLKSHGAVLPMMRALRENCLEGAAQALTELRVRSVIPLLIQCLEDDIARGPASKCLVRFFPDSIPALQGSAVERNTIAGVETSRSVARRAEAVRLLGMSPMQVSHDLLFCLLSDDAGPVQLNAALALSSWGEEQDRSRAFPILLSFRQKGNWLEQNLCEEALRSWGFQALSEFLRHSERESNQTQAEQQPVLTFSQRSLLRRIIKELQNTNW